ncbi:MAG: hypothetical protein B7Z75_03915 [Acidocella sp. 20-57-95]|nr:MAG: hypothetical protein B7Z75_03915 [Acidocella sp. 20-57-95]OYV60270.1 MAG: hypothetical protein B7Z71_06500 [Acidocella sp. 21-58-7]HQT63926.1 hypothetical protein [Acidocella sp.]HQU03653.1 hypothetical protein [Acidocella sp.]
MTFLFASQGSVLATGRQQRALISALPTSGSAPAGSFAGPYPSAITGLSGWWDAGLLGGLRDVNAAPVVAANVVVGSVVDKSGNGIALLPYHIAVDTSPPATIAAPRVNGYLGAVGAPDATIATYGPTLDPDWGLSHAGFALGASTGWTRYLVWTRPNLRQSTYYGNGSPIPLLHCVATGTTILQADSVGSNLTLFPGTASQCVLSSSLARRHSHAVILRNTPGEGVDVWLDGAQVATAIANPLGSSATGQVLYLHDGTAQGSAQCWFHEAANWERALSAAEITTLIECQARWVLGARKGIMVLVMGQSNAAWFAVSGGALALAQGIAWYCGAASYAMIESLSGTNISPNRYTVIFGHPISNSSPPLFPTGAGNGTFITNPGDGSDPSTWAPGPDFAAVSAYLTGLNALLPAIDDNDIGFLVWPWSEQDSTMPYANKALYKGTVLRLLALTRSLLGRTAGTLPLLAWNAIPYETNDGVQMVRESIADLAGDAANNITMFIDQTADSNPLNASYNPATGIFTGGDPQHRDQPDLLRYGKIGAHAAGRLAVALGQSDSIPNTALPATGLPLKGGPQIIHVYRASNTSLVLTVSHDSGNDLLLPLQAARGAGFAVMDGGTVANPGNIITATSATRIDATHIGITLASAIKNPSAVVLFFYPYGSTQIGRGNAVTDNASLMAPPPNWNIGNDLGTSWLVNLPLQATTYPITLSDTPA